jgi:hypothetical protein
MASVYNILTNREIVKCILRKIYDETTNKSSKSSKRIKNGNPIDLLSKKIRMEIGEKKEV